MELQAVVLPEVYRVVHLGRDRFPRGYCLPKDPVAIFPESGWQRPGAGEPQPVLGWADLFFGSPAAGEALSKRRWGRLPIVARVAWAGDGGLLWTPASWLAPMINIDSRGRIEGWIGLLLTVRPNLEDL